MLEGMLKLRNPANRHPSERFGQAVVNRYGFRQVPELFYANDDKAEAILRKWAVDYQW